MHIQHLIGVRIFLAGKSVWKIKDDNNTVTKLLQVLKLTDSK